MLSSVKTVRKAVIPAAGLGTRMLPISRSVPKEMLPIVDRPAVSYLVEEAVLSGITDILIITNREKDCIENYFDYSPEYENHINANKNDTAKKKAAAIAQLRKAADMANIYFLRQKETRGLGHAVGRARSFIGNEPFVVLYGDDIIFSEKPVCLQLIEAYEKYGRAAVAVKEVCTELVMKYCTLKTHAIEGSFNEFFVDDMIEKPKKEQIMSHYSILGRVLLDSDVFDIIDSLPPGKGGEIQLTDAMGIIARTAGVTAVDFEGTRFDLGSKIGFLKANITKGLQHPETADELYGFLSDIIKSNGING